MRLSEIPTPALLLDLDILERNLVHMAGRARALGVALRPHVKTHKCVEVARMQAELGTAGITVSTLAEARAFADHGFTDMTWAFPVPLSRLDETRELAERVTLRLVVDSEEAVTALENLGVPLHVWLKVDCGYHRAGVDPASPQAEEVARRIASSYSLRFDGLLTHSGHAYHGRTREEVAAAAAQERQVMDELAERLRGRGIEVPGVSVGSTPAMAVAESLAGVTEARPGNYVFYDFMQVGLGSCAVRDCALTLLATVISARPGDARSVVDAGALALSRDPGLAWTEPKTFGEVFADYEAGVLSPIARLESLSQEHGILSRRRPVGTRVRLLPNHSCLAAACFDEYLVVRGDEVVDRWKIWRGR